MTKSALLSSTAVALFLGLAPANAQMQQKEERSSPSQVQQERSQQEKGAAQSQTPEQQGKASKESADKSKEKATKGSAQKDSEPKSKSTKGTAERSEPKDKASKGGQPNTRDKAAADRQSEPKDRQGAADKSAEPKDKATKGTAERETPSRDKAAATERSGSGQRVQLTEDKRTNINQTILKDRNVNRISNVNFSINIGTRVPRSVRLAALPVAVYEIVPEYRSYQYFVVDDQICIVEPSTYEIVEVIRVSDRTAARDGRSTSAGLILTEREKEILLREVDMRGDSTLALGSLTEGSDVPRDVSLKTFPAAVVEQVPKVRDYKYLTAENRLAIVEPRGSKVELVIEQRR